ncbi:MAG: hypothetical protein H7Y03_03845 [Chitinophagaceae bacterium]|nr:hypothetical protein [Chitinophagaceae bacterium]
MKSTYSLALIATVLILMTACSKDDDEQVAETPLTAETTVTDKDGNVYRTGYDQVTSTNQDAYLEKKNASGETIWKKIYDGSPVDTRGVYVVLDGDQDPWVAFSADGGSVGASSFNQKEIEPNAFTGVYKSGYGQGGGPRIIIAAHINRETGKIIKGSYLIARLQSGNTNSIFTEKIGINGKRMVLQVKSAFKPPAAGGPGSFVEHPDALEENKRDGAWILRMVFSTDFSSIEESTVLK